MQSFPMLTVGNLLLALANLKGRSISGSLSPNENTEYARLEREIEALHHKWTVAWQKNASHEYGGPAAICLFAGIS